MRCFFVFLILGFSGVCALGEEAFRTWTDVAQRQVEGVLEGVEGTQVQLRLRDGQVVKVPMDGLSKQDQAWIRDWVKRSEDGYQGPPAEEDWPRIVRSPDLSIVEIISEDEEKNEFTYETKNYRFISDIQFSTSLVREISEVFEATLLVNSLLPLDLRPIPEPGREKFVARIFENESDFFQAGGLEGSTGTYRSGEKELIIPISSLGVKRYGNKVSMDYTMEDFRSLIHVITLQNLNRWNSKLPVWLMHGAAEYLQVADYDNGRYAFSRQDDRLANKLNDHYESPFPMVSVHQLMTTTYGQWNHALAQGEASKYYVSALLLTYYFYHLDGENEGEHIQAFFKDLKQMQPRGNSWGIVNEHLLRNKTFEELQEEIVEAFRRKGIQIEFRGPIMIP